MSNVVSSRQAHAYDHVSQIPDEVWSALSQNEEAANVILPFAKEAKNSCREDDKKQLWIALYDTNSVEFVLSCTKGPLGDYPIFIVPCKLSAQEEEHSRNLSDSLLPLILCLLENLSSPKRVCSVFSTVRVAETFAEIFETCVPQECGIRAIKKPYYDAAFMFCTSETFAKSLDVTCKQKHDSEDIVVALRRADKSHLGGIKAMCKAFSETSDHYRLEDAQAEVEAELLITGRQAWVHLAQKKGEEPEIACLVAATRESDNVTAVTKIFTAEKWREYGCASRLLHRVCHDILQRDLKKKRVVLYVGNELKSASNLYRKVGFQTFDGQQDKDAGKWLEIGFDNTDHGHW